MAIHIGDEKINEIRGGNAILALNKQMHIYSVDTSAFYTEEEQRIHNNMNWMYYARNNFKKEIEHKNTTDERKSNLRGCVATINRNIQTAKAQLKKILDENMNEVRYLNTNHLVDRNVVSIFDSVLTRTIGMEQSTVSKDIMIVQTYFFSVTENIIKNGFVHKYIDESGNEIEERYVVYTASAGQIRTKKTVFIKESVWNKYKNTLLCGLSIDKINKNGGVNVNKYLAYLALNNSATDDWKDFDIDKSIVVDDMETTVNALMDFIDHETFEIERKRMSIKIEHTDGCGMMLYPRFKKSHMCRLPFIKGLLAAVPFKKFIREKKASPKIKDIYGKEWDIVEKGIEVIFTKSQFKMWKYYKDWQEYKDCYKKYGCQAGICNQEEDRIKDSRLNYQMLQTLTDISDDELMKLATPTICDINSVGSDRDTMLRILGVRPENKNKNHFQQALELYPEMLREPYAKEVLKQTRQSLIKQAKSGKVRINAKYTFVIPDMYAFCEWLFLGDKTPKGLLRDGEVSCNMYEDSTELDCLRSPHLYREHAVRKNVVNKETKRWFKTKGIYASVDDAISRILQFDNDGDKLLISPNKTLVDVAKRNMKDIVPLYYEMKKADSSNLDSNAMFNGLKAAYTGGNIGIISNEISKIWNADEITEDAIESVKILTAMNNYVIDYAKTLYKPDIPEEKDKMIKEFTKKKLPHFFISAKDKKEKQVQLINNSVMGRLENMIPNKRLLFKVHNLKKFDYKILMKNPKTKVRQDIIDVYESISGNHYFKGGLVEDFTNTKYVSHQMLSEMLLVEPDINILSDVLIKYLYGKKSTRRKNVLWYCFGDIIVENIRENVKDRYGDNSKLCVVCGERIEVKRDSKQYCNKCWEQRERERKRKAWHKAKKSKKN